MKILDFRCPSCGYMERDVLVDSQNNPIVRDDDKKEMVCPKCGDTMKPIPSFRGPLVIPY